LKESVKKEKSESLEKLLERLDEMYLFYQLMEKHFNNFLTEWSETTKD